MKLAASWVLPRRLLRMRSGGGGAPVGPYSRAKRGELMADRYDVVVVGSGPAGCTAAIVLGRAGLRVALLEAHRDPQAYKRLCTHFIQSSALPTLARLGLDTAIEQAGGVRNRGYAWSRYGWIAEPEPTSRPSHGYNLRREVLDPMMRAPLRPCPASSSSSGPRCMD